MGNASEPGYYSPKSLWDKAEELGLTQGGKLLWVTHALFWNGPEYVSVYRLPREAQGFFEGFSGRVLAARRMRLAKAKAAERAKSVEKTTGFRGFSDEKRAENDSFFVVP